MSFQFPVFSTVVHLAESLGIPNTCLIGVISVLRYLLELWGRN